jgi:NADH:ubiquinone oxidoreductase subunit F (NADH-binding)
LKHLALVSLLRLLFPPAPDFRPLSSLSSFFALTRRGEKQPQGAFREFEAIVAALRHTSLCGHGTGLAAFVASLGHHYRKELEACLG